MDKNRVHSRQSSGNTKVAKDFSAPSSCYSVRKSREKTQTGKKQEDPRLFDVDVWKNNLEVSEERGARASGIAAGPVPIQRRDKRIFI